jgi:hypothetical protein
MEPTEQAFLLDLVIYLVAAALAFLLGFATGRAGRAKAERRAADQAWRMSETLHRHSDQP